MDLLSDENLRRKIEEETRKYTAKSDKKLNASIPLVKTNFGSTIVTFDIENVPGDIGVIVSRLLSKYYESHSGNSHENPIGYTVNAKNDYETTKVSVLFGKRQEKGFKEGSIIFERWDEFYSEDIDCVLDIWKRVVYVKNQH